MTAANIGATINVTDHAAPPLGIAHIIMNRSRRSAPAVVVSALIFGSLASPFSYLLPRLWSAYTEIFRYLVLPVLVACVALLLLVLIKQTGIERSLRTRLGRAFPPLFYTVVVAAFLLTYKILAIVANFTLLTRLEYWYYLAYMFGFCVAVTLVIVAAAPPSRLESAIAHKLATAGVTRAYWRILIYGAVPVLLSLCVWAVHRKLAFDAAALEQMGWHGAPELREVLESKRQC